MPTKTCPDCVEEGAADPTHQASGRYCAKHRTRRYRATQAGKDAAKRYQQSEKGKATRIRYETSEKGRATKQRWFKTEQGQRVRRANARTRSEILKVIEANKGEDGGGRQQEPDDLHPRRDGS